MAEYLGKNVDCLLQSAPFKQWPVKRAVDSDADPPVIGYVFEGCGLQLNCDMDGRVRSIFLEAEEHDGYIMSEVQLDSSRERVIELFGTPSKSGGSTSHPVLGDLGPWDRFRRPGYTVHVEYRIGSEGIEKITLMRNDVAP